MKKNICVALTNRTNYSKLKTVLFASVSYTHLDVYKRQIRLYATMRVHGYQPMRFPNSYIGGTWLEAQDGRRRFVVMQGNHRIAVLAHLQVDKIDVRTIPQALSYVSESAIRQWPLVANGRCSVEHARRVFNLFFSENGWHVAKLATHAA